MSDQYFIDFAIFANILEFEEILYCFNNRLLFYEYCLITKINMIIGLREALGRVGVRERERERDDSIILLNSISRNFWWRKK